VLHPDDAATAVERGVDGLIVSNHGGRQLDGAVGALQALPRVVDAADGRVPVLFDSGVRRGPDALKALALGADAVCLGRPYLYGLSLAGETGVRDVLRHFLGDLDVALGLAGYTNVADIDQSALWRSHEGS
jgi:isopentenyl-diphosphate delta-isomerase